MRLIVFSLGTALLVLAGNFGQLRAQEGVANEATAEVEPLTESYIYRSEKRAFYDEIGELLVTGEFVKMDGATVEILTGNGKSLFKLREFSKEDQEYIRKQNAIVKKYERYEEQTLETLREINGLTDIPKLVRACNKLRGYGEAAEKAEASMRGFFTHEDYRLKRASFRAYFAIVEVKESYYNLFIREMSTNTWGMREAFKARPEGLLESALRFRQWSMPYLQHVAYTGRIRLLDGEPDLNAAPTKFTIAKSDKNDFRAAACKVLGQSKDEDAVNILTDVLAVAEQPVSGVRDNRTIKAIIESFGNLGYVNDNVVEALNKFEKDFPEEVKKSKEQIRERIRVEKEREESQDDK